MFNEDGDVMGMEVGWESRALLAAVFQVKMKVEMTFHLTWSFEIQHHRYLQLPPEGIGGAALISAPL